MCQDLCRAIQQGDLDRAEELIDNGSSVHDREATSPLLDPWTPLQNAHKSVEMTRLLLDRGASLDSEGPRTALHMASGNGFVQVVRLYLDNGTDVDLNGDTGSPFFYAIESGEEEVAKLLLDRGANPNFDAGIGPGGPLHEACAQANLGMVELLLDHDADANADDEDFGTPMEWLCVYGNDVLCPIARLLLERGATVKDDILLSLNFHENEVDRDHADLVDLLIENGANPNPEDKGHWTPLLRACETGFVDTVECLVNRGVPVDGNRGNDGMRPLHVACSIGWNTIVRLLLERGAEVNAIDNLGDTPLLSVLHAADLEDRSFELIVRLLLERGARVDARGTDNNETPLHIASRRCKKRRNC